MDCREASLFITLRVDGEIDALDDEELGRHLAQCRFCQQFWSAERDARAIIREKLKIHFEKRAHGVAPGLRARIQREGRRQRAQTRRSLVLGLPIAACVALASVTLLVPEDFQDVLEPSELLHVSVSRHSANLPPELRVRGRDHRELDDFLRQHLRFPLGIPRRFADRNGPRLLGARLSHLNDRDVAYLMFDHRGARMSLFAYPHGLGVSTARGRRGLKRHSKDIYVGRNRGYNVVSWAESGGDFSLISELDLLELLKWAPHLRGKSVKPNPGPPHIRGTWANRIRTVRTK